MLAPYLRPALPRRRVLYLMSPMTLYGSPVLEAAREYPFADLTGCPVEVWVAEDMYRSNPEWAALWPLVRRRADCAVFLDRHGWVARGVRVRAGAGRFPLPLQPRRTGLPAASTEHARMPPGSA